MFNLQWVLKVVCLLALKIQLALATFDHLDFNSCSSALLLSGEGPRAHLQRLAEYIRWSYGAGIVLRLGNIARLELNYCFPMGVQSGDRLVFHTSFFSGDWF